MTDLVRAERLQRQGISVYRSLALLTEREQLSVETMRERLETFVGERTMLTLLPENRKPSARLKYTVSTTS